MNETCTICLHESKSPICQLSCSHSFCKPCIENWCLHSNFCPICKSPISEATIFENSDSIAITLISTVPKAPESFDCLDHSFFRTQLRTLLNKIGQIELNNFKKRNSRGTPSEWRVLQAIKGKIEGMSTENLAFVQFNPEELALEVQTLDEELAEVRLGEIPTRWERESRPASEYEYSSDSDYDEDDYY